MKAEAHQWLLDLQGTPSPHDNGPLSLERVAGPRPSMVQHCIGLHRKLPKFFHLAHLQAQDHWYGRNPTEVKAFAWVDMWWGWVWRGRILIAVISQSQNASQPTCNQRRGNNKIFLPLDLCRPQYYTKTLLFAQEKKQKDLRQGCFQA